MDRNARISFAFATLLAWTFILGLSGCQTFDVRSDWDPEVSFPEFRRYHWIEPPEREDSSPFADNTLLRKRVRRAIEGVLEERGFFAVDQRDGAYFLVTYSVILEERLQVDSLGTTAGAGLRSRYYGFGSIHSTANIRRYQESTLIIDFLKPENDDLLWRGWGSGVVRTRDRDRGQERLEKGTRAILAKFPPNSN